VTDKTTSDAVATGSVPAASGARATAANTPMDAARNRRERSVLWVLLVAAFVVILNETIMSVAIKTLQIDLGIDAARPSGSPRPSS